MADGARAHLLVGQFGDQFRVVVEQQRRERAVGAARQRHGHAVLAGHQFVGRPGPGFQRRGHGPEQVGAGRRWGGPPAGQRRTGGGHRVVDVGGAGVGAVAEGLAGGGLDDGRDVVAGTEPAADVDLCHACALSVVVNSTPSASRRSVSVSSNPRMSRQISRVSCPGRGAGRRTCRPDVPERCGPRLRRQRPVEQRVGHRSVQAAGHQLRVGEHVRTPVHRRCGHPRALQEFGRLAGVRALVHRCQRRARP